MLKTIYVISVEISLNRLTKAGKMIFLFKTVTFHLNHIFSVKHDIILSNSKQNLNYRS